MRPLAARFSSLFDEQPSDFIFQCPPDPQIITGTLARKDVASPPYFVEDSFGLFQGQTGKAHKRPLRELVIVAKKLRAHCHGRHSERSEESLSFSIRKSYARLPLI